MTISRREALALATGSIAAASIPVGTATAAVTDVPSASVKPPDYRLERGAELRVLRPAKFIDPDEVYWRENTRKFTDATGIPVRVDFLSWEDIRPQTAVVANTGAGPDIVVGFSSDPQIYASKLADMTDLAEYLGAKYGGWQQLAILYGTKWKTNRWISIPIGGGAGPTVYRQSWVKEAGYDSIPEDHEGFLSLCRNLQKTGHPCGFSLGHALGDANGFASWLLWSHNAMLVDENGRIALDSKETIAALKYATELQKTMVAGTLSWNDTSNNKAFAAGSISLTFNGVSVYYFLKNAADPTLNQMAADTQHQLLPKGRAPTSPMSATPMNAMLFKHTKYPNAAKEYLRFMMEADQYGPWLSNCIGYWSNSLKAYSKMKFWTEDPKLIPYAGGMDTPYYDGFAGPVTPASSAVTANYTVVDMFAAVVTGNATPEDAAKRAAQQAARYYKTS